jgi:DNA-binding PadR family transcriptional regulator
MDPVLLGEFEQLLMLAILRLDAAAFGADITRELEQRADRHVSRGALYTSLDRLEQKGLVRWALAAGTPERDGLPRRCYSVTAAGVAALRASRVRLLRMWRGLGDVLSGCDPTEAPGRPR